MSDALNNPTVQQYHPTVSVPAHQDSGTLPLTGFDMAAILVVAVILVVMGAALRRVA